MTAKQQALLDLARARKDLGDHLHLASQELNPRAIFMDSVRKHPWIWLGAASFAGLLAVRAVLPARGGKIERDNLTTSAKKSGLIALILTPMIAMARQSAWKYGSQYLQSYLTQHFSRHEGERPRA